MRAESPSRAPRPTAAAHRRALCALAAGGAALLALAGCAGGPPPPHSPRPDTPATAATAASLVTGADERLRRLLDDSDAASLARRPIEALYRGERRDPGGHEDDLSPAFVAADRAAAEADLSALDTLPRGALSPVGQLAYDSFRWRRSLDLRALDPALLAVRAPLEVDPFDGWHLHFPAFSSGAGGAPFETADDYRDGLLRLAGHARWLDAAAARLREGARRGVTLPRFAIDRLIAQFDRLLAQPPEASAVLGPTRRWPASLSGGERADFDAAYRRAHATLLVPAWTRWRDLLRDEIRPRAREAAGLSAVPGGAAWYRFLIEEHTTLALGPDEIHDLGLAEVARLREAMDLVRRELGRPGPLPAFVRQMREDPALRPASADALLARYREVGTWVEAALPRLFSQRPRSPLEIRETPAESAPGDAAARYDAGTPDGSRPGVFYVNTHALATRSLAQVDTLYLHEALPGHHLQISLAQEQTQLPPLLRFGGFTAYVEGWALYAEGLGPRLGLADDPVQRFGRLDNEMLRALRLVIDTGLHTRGWTREQSIELLMQHTSLGEPEAIAEVERYIVYPGQALAYKLGELSILRLRDEAQAALGEQFDWREFHDQILLTGALPLPVLEAKVHAWLEARRRAFAASPLPPSPPSEAPFARPERSQDGQGRVAGVAK